MFTRNSPLYLPGLSMLAAIELALAFSAFGYITIPPVSLTIMPLPVLAGALLFGPAEGAFLGAVFGLTSLWKASVTATSHADMVFSPLVSGSPLSSLVLSVGTRMAFGFLAACLFLYVKKRVSHIRTGIAFAAIAADFLHSFLVYAALQTLFPELGITVERLFSRMLSLNKLLGWGVVVVVALGAYAVSGSRALRVFTEELAQAKWGRPRPRVALSMVGLIALMFLLALGLWRHLYGRTEVLLKLEGISMSAEVQERFWLLGMQFLVAVIALFFVVAVVLVLVERYLMQMAQQAKRDMMTGLYNKMTLIRLVDAALREGGDAGFLIIVDVDDFKRLNDAHGHPVGDKILIAVAGLLKERFEPYGVVGRLGGDEFCVYVEGLSAAQTVKAADGVCEAVAALSVAGARGVSCSMGVASCTGRQEFSQAYAAADQALYRSKARGKNRCSLEGDERI